MNAGLPRVAFSDRHPAARGLLEQPDDVSGPAVLLMGNVMGISPFLLDVQSWLGDAGHPSLALDYYSVVERGPLNGFEEKMAAADRIFCESVLQTAEDAVGHLRAEFGSAAVIGYCVGGSLALNLSARAPELSAGVMMYGQLLYEQGPGRVQPLEAAEAIRCPFQAHVGVDDPLTPPAHVARLREALGPGRAVHAYGDAGHAFDEHDRPDVYRPAASEQARTRILALLSDPAL